MSICPHLGHILALCWFRFIWKTKLIYFMVFLFCFTWNIGLCPVFYAYGSANKICSRFLRVRYWSWSIMHNCVWPLGDAPIKKKKADLLSLSSSSLLMIPSISFWEDLYSPLTPVRTGRLKQLKVPSISAVANRSSRGFLGNAKRQ